MPFITEELWQRLPHAGSAPPLEPLLSEEESPRIPLLNEEGSRGRWRGNSISLTPFSFVNQRAADPVSEKQFELIQDLVTSLRNAKAEMGLQKVKPSAQVACEDLRWLELFRSHLESILRLSTFQALTLTRERLEATTPGVRSGPLFTLRVFYEQPVDHDAELARLEKEKQKTEQALAQVQKQLDNEHFVARAPQEVVRSVTRRRDELREHLHRIRESIGTSTRSRPV
jgi:valyl-tRNA synthetase